VFLNRGNHEDFFICCVYGFQAESCRKYNDVTFGMFVELFNYLPLFTIVNDAIFVTHGGLFHCQDVTIAELNKIHRFDFTLKDIPEGGESDTHIPREKETDFLKQLQRDALWSDPNDSVECLNNPRGAGVAFGPSVVRKFLTQNNLKMVVRSHECVRTGFDTPYSGDDANLLCTVFSASNYGDAGNTAAYMVFTIKDGGAHLDPLLGGTAPVEVPETNLVYSVFYFDLSEKLEDEDAKTIVSIGESSGLSMYGLVLQHKAQLENEFRSFDKEKSGRVTKMQWAECMQSVLRLHLHWGSMLSVLVPKDSLVNVGDDSLGDIEVDYMSFLGSISATVAGMDELKDDDGLSDDTGSITLIESLYAHHKRLETVFRWFAGDHAGVITKEDFIRGCEMLNQDLPPESQIKDVQKLLSIMDVSRTGEIDVNEFFEMFRLSDSKGDISSSIPAPPPIAPRALDMPSPPPSLSLDAVPPSPLGPPSPATHTELGHFGQVVGTPSTRLLMRDSPLQRVESRRFSDPGKKEPWAKQTHQRIHHDEIIDKDGIAMGSVAVNGITISVENPRRNMNIISPSVATEGSANTDNSVQLDI
jgi:Ca2+-binding EF-hand superfamily protein